MRIAWPVTRDTKIGRTPTISSSKLAVSKKRCDCTQNSQPAYRSSVLSSTIASTSSVGTRWCSAANASAARCASSRVTDEW